MGSWGGKVCDNLASKRDTESISSETSDTEITGLVYYTNLETHKSEDYSCVIFQRERLSSVVGIWHGWNLLLSEMSEIQYSVTSDFNTPCI